MGANGSLIWFEVNEKMSTRDAPFKIHLLEVNCQSPVNCLWHMAKSKAHSSILARLRQQLSSLGVSVPSPAE